MDQPLPGTREGDGPGPGKPEAHQARHDMQCVQMMLETVQYHSEPLVRPITGVERVPCGCGCLLRERVRSAPYTSWKKHTPYHLCPAYGWAPLGAFDKTENDVR